MFQADTQFLIDHWHALAARPEVRGGIPGRQSFVPEVLGGRLTRAFLLDGAGPEARLRVAGSLLEVLRDATLTGRPFHELWCEASPALVTPALSRSVREGRPVVVTAQLGDGAPAEVCVAPLRARSDGAFLILGLLAAEEREVRRASPARLVARLAVAAGESRRPPLRLVSSRRIA